MSAIRLLNMLLLLLMLLSADCILAQSAAMDTSALMKAIDPKRLEDEAEKKFTFLENRIKKANDKMIARFEKQQEKLRRKLQKIDSSKALLLFGNAEKGLLATNGKIQQVSEKANSLMQQFSAVDELNVATGFVRKLQLGKSGIAASMGKLQELKTRLASLNNEIDRAEAIKQYIQERQLLLREQLSQLKPGRYFEKLNRQTAEYRHLIRDYKQILSEPGRVQQLALDKLKRIPAFNDFFRRHSALASLFPQSSGIVGVSSGMQTVESAALLLSNRLDGGANGALQQVTTQIQQVQNSFNGLLNQSTGNTNTLDMPTYGAEQMKSKTLLQRIEFGTNIQFVRPNGIFPQTANIALQAGYKWSKKGTIGVGIAYRLGMGEGFDKIKFTNEGLGLRSFADFKLKGNLFINGGFEQNYNASFTRIAELQNMQRWTGSALLGISKKTNGPKKLKTNVQLLYDFLHKRNQPATPAFLFRVGYNF
jgi:hypothetical protein